MNRGDQRPTYIRKPEFMDRPPDFICQSCSLPLTHAAVFGTEEDGSPSDEYCFRCYQEGKFSNGIASVEEMLEYCMPYMEDYMDEKHARIYLSEVLPTLKRWRE